MADVSTKSSERWADMMDAEEKAQGVVYQAQGSNLEIYVEIRDTYEQFCPRVATKYNPSRNHNFRFRVPKRRGGQSAAINKHAHTSAVSAYAMLGIDFLKEGNVYGGLNYLLAAVKIVNDYEIYPKEKNEGDASKLIAEFEKSGCLTGCPKREQGESAAAYYERIRPRACQMQLLWLVGKVNEGLEQFARHIFDIRNQVKDEIAGEIETKLLRGAARPKGGEALAELRARVQVAERADPEIEVRRGQRFQEKLEGLGLHLLVTNLSDKTSTFYDKTITNDLQRLEPNDSDQKKSPAVFRLLAKLRVIDALVAIGKTGEAKRLFFTSREEFFSAKKIDSFVNSGMTVPEISRVVQTTENIGWAEANAARSLPRGNYDKKKTKFQESERWYGAATYLAEVMGCKSEIQDRIQMQRYALFMSRFHYESQHMVVEEQRQENLEQLLREIADEGEKKSRRKKRKKKSKARTVADVAVVKGDDNNVLELAPEVPPPSEEAVPEPELHSSPLAYLRAHKQDNLATVADEVASAEAKFHAYNQLGAACFLAVEKEYQWCCKVLSAMGKYGGLAKHFLDSVSEVDTLTRRMKARANPLRGVSDRLRGQFPLFSERLERVVHHLEQGQEYFQGAFVSLEAMKKERVGESLQEYRGYCTEMRRQLGDVRKKVDHLGTAADTVKTYHRLKVEVLSRLGISPTGVAGDGPTEKETLSKIEKFTESKFPSLVTSYAKMFSKTGVFVSGPGAMEVPDIGSCYLYRSEASERGRG